MLLVSVLNLNIVVLYQWHIVDGGLVFMFASLRAERYSATFARA